LDKGRKFFAVGVVGHWSRFPREVVDALLPGSVQGQAGWGFGQPGLVEVVPACGRVVGTR